MSIDALLDRLDGAKETGHGKYIVSEAWLPARGGFRRLRVRR